MEAVTGMHRKGLIRRMAGRPERKKRRRQRGPTYGSEVKQVVPGGVDSRRGEGEVPPS